MAGLLLARDEESQYYQITAGLIAGDEADSQLVERRRIPTQKLNTLRQDGMSRTVLRISLFHSSPIYEAIGLSPNPCQSFRRGLSCDPNHTTARLVSQPHVSRPI
jgi:hypothetical protein